MAVLIGGITAKDTVTDNATLHLDSPWGLYALSIGDSAYVYGQGEGDDGVSAFELDPDGSLTNIQNIDDNATLELDGADGFGSATVGGTTYLFVNGYVDDGISAFRVNADGTLTNTDNVTDSATLELDQAQSQMATATVGGASFLIASGTSDDGISVFRINAGGTLTNTDNVTDGGALELASAEDVASATVGGHVFVFAAGTGDDGISVFELDGSGNLTNTDNVTDNATLELDGAWGVATAKVDGTTFLVASGIDDDGLSVFSVSATGQLTNVFNVSDNATLGLDGAASLSTFTLDGESFVAVSGEDDSALTIFHLGASGALTDVTTIFDNAATALGGTLANAFVVVDGRPMLVGNGRNDNGLTSFDIGSGNDTLNGTTTADLLLGLAGRDDLNGRGGNDDLHGDSGVDDLDGGIGKDTLSGGQGADILLGGKDKDFLSGDQGADDFVYTKLNQSGTTNATRDRILDFKGQDDIDLNAIDAIRFQPGNQDFTIDKNGDFQAGEIRVREVNAGTFIEVNTDRDSAAEMSILLVDYHGPINHSDFIF